MSFPLFGGTILGDGYPAAESLFGYSWGFVRGWGVKSPTPSPLTSPHTQPTACFAISHGRGEFLLPALALAFGTLPGRYAGVLSEGRLGGGNSPGEGVRVAPCPWLAYLPSLNFNNAIVSSCNLALAQSFWLGVKNSPIPSRMWRLLIFSNCLIQVRRNSSKGNPDRSSRIA